MKAAWRNFSVLFVVVALVFGTGINAQAATKIRSPWEMWRR